MRSPRPSKYFVEYISLATAALPTFDPTDPDPAFEYEDATTLKVARKVAETRIQEGALGARVTIYQRGDYEQHARGWDYLSSPVESVVSE